MSTFPQSAAASSLYNDHGTRFQDFFITRSTMCMSADLPEAFSYIKCTSPFAETHERSSVYNVDINLSSINVNTIYDEPLRQCGGSIKTRAPLVVTYDPQVAALRIFISILLHSWRKRRRDIKILKENVEYLKGVSIHARTQIHLFNKLFRSEQRRNDKLICQLKESVETISNAKSSCDNLATSVISLKADKALMDQELRVKCKDYDALNIVFTRTKTDLYQALVDQRSLESSLSKEQRNAKNIEEQRDKLINELSLLRAENEHAQQKYRLELEQKDKELQYAISTMKSLESTVEKLKEEVKRVDKLCENDVTLHHEIDELHEQVTQLEHSISNSLDVRLRSIWSRLYNYQKLALAGIHNVAYYLLPATPAPQVAAIL